MRIQLETSSGVPITRQIVDQIRTACASGTLRPGERLPSVRELAGQLAVNQNTILRVYERLTAEGLLERKHGDGTFVCENLPGGQLKAQRQVLRDELARIAQRCRTLGMESDEMHAMLDRAIADSNGKAKEK
jgi:GntR family transcriptional regulator